MMYKKVRAACMIIGASSVALLIWFFGMQLVRFFSLETLQCYAGYFIEFSRNHYTTSILVYLLVGIISILFFLPVVTLYMVAAGFFFGPWEGAFYAIIGSTIGACCAFMFVRTTAGP